MRLQTESTLLVQLWLQPEDLQALSRGMELVEVKSYIFGPPCVVHLKLLGNALEKTK